MALLFYAMLAFSLGGYMSFSVAAIQALYRVPLAEANLPLTLYPRPAPSGSSPAGGGADRTQQHHHAVGGSFPPGRARLGADPELLPPLGVTAALFALAGFFFGRGQRRRAT